MKKKSNNCVLIVLVGVIFLGFVGSVSYRYMFGVTVYALNGNSTETLQSEVFDVKDNWDFRFYGMNHSPSRITIKDEAGKLVRVIGSDYKATISEYFAKGGRFYAEFDWGDMEPGAWRMAIVQRPKKN